jgi:uncharacterized protein (DUF1697 family)
VPVYVALLRAVNVGGTGALAMTDLRRLCTEAGFTRVATYIQSGNVVFASTLGEAKVKVALEAALTVHMGKPSRAVVRSAAEIADVLKRNPFARRPPNRVIVAFLDAPAPHEALDALLAPGGESVRLSGREVFIHYPDGQGRSKLKLPLLAQATGRNINTVAKLAAMAAALDDG